MAICIDPCLAAGDLVPPITRLFELSAVKLRRLERRWRPARGTPVFTVRGRYTARGWTEWTQGFQVGSALLQFEATDDPQFLALGRRQTIDLMARHVSHLGVHDHGFNNVSTYGNLLRLLREGRAPDDPGLRACCELALKVSGAVQAARWTRLADGTGFIHSFNGAHSLFVDTLRSLRSLALAHRLGHVLLGEQDARISLLERLIEHALNTARYNVYYGEGRDIYDVRGRTAHEAVFNPASGVFRCPNSQQGYSPFTTWTRGLAWALCGFAEQLEFLATLTAPDRAALDDWAARHPGLRFPAGARRVTSSASLERALVAAACSTADFYLAHACADGIPFWDTGAPHLARLPPGYLDRPADPANAWEPVDSSAAAIAAQGLLRLGRVLFARGDSRAPLHYGQAGLTLARTLFHEPYLCTDPRHEGLLLHSVYHRPNGWDFVAPGQRVPNGESSLWGDYHLRELALLILRDARQLPPLTFFGDL